MIREDYLLRLIQQLGEFFRRTVGGQSSGSSNELEVHLEQLSGEIIGLPQELLLTLPTSELINLFEISDRMVIEKCFVTAEIHRLKAKVETDPIVKKRCEDRTVFFYTTVQPALTGDLADPIC